MSQLFGIVRQKLTLTPLWMLEAGVLKLTWKNARKGTESPRCEWERENVMEEVEGVAD